MTSQLWTLQRTDENIYSSKNNNRKQWHEKNLIQATLITVRRLVTSTAPENTFF